jgi:hypothetical protein
MGGIILGGTFELTVLDSKAETVADFSPAKL